MDAAPLDRLIFFVDTRDAPPRPDAPIPDLRPPDLVPDAPPPDQPPPKPDMFQPQAKCIAKYGKIKGFKFCSATTKACVFYRNGGSTSCISLCQGEGGTCVAAMDDQGPCKKWYDSSCYAPMANSLCKCSI